MKNTATCILDAAQELIQTRGFTAMSFKDIAEQVGIKKPSIIHHFSSKSILGTAVVRRYRQHYAEALETIKADPKRTVWEALEFYFSPFLEFSETENTVCLCGALAGEIMLLEPEMREEVQRFFEWHQRWLEDILREGRESGSFEFSGSPQSSARLFFSALQGALLVKRTTGDPSQLHDVVQMIRDNLQSQ